MTNIGDSHLGGPALDIERGELSDLIAKIVTLTHLDSSGQA